ncbi:unnamed protein product, partial [Polarella glacialis]
EAKSDSAAKLILSKVLAGLTRTPAVCTPGAGRHRQDNGLVCYSLLEPVLRKEVGESRECWRLLKTLADADAGCGAAIACLIGLAIGDSVGAPLEFVPVNPGLPDLEGGFYSNADRPHLLPGLHGGSLKYQREFNKFHLKPGQWTDDSSMALCLADSLLVHGVYHGGDARVRWHMWWNHGYCNAFGHDTDRPAQTSVGLGGNVAKAMDDVEYVAQGLPNAADVVPSIYGSKSNA